MARPYFCKNKKIEEIIRVDHAGEYGAVRIYSGQIAHANHQDREVLTDMLEHEQEHLEYFSYEIATHQYRPTALRPLWKIGGYAMGALTRLIDPKAAMLCTQAVEEVIEQHYAEQIDELSSLDEPELLAKVSQFREEELEHRDIALRHDSSHSPGYFIIYHAVQSVCKLAINLSKKF